MKLKAFETNLSVCKVADLGSADLSRELTFVGITDEETSLVCPTDAAPGNVVEREDGWRALRIEGVLDFSLKGILARISGVLADAGVGIFAVSTFNTDYILMKAADFDRALEALAKAGYDIV